MKPSLTLMLAGILLMTAGCGKKRVTWSDPSLPESAEGVEIATPTAILVSGAQSEEPSVRARALALLIQSASAADDDGYATRALWDPDAWVQAQAVSALAQRLDEAAAVALLEGFVARSDGLADPYARGAAAGYLARAGHSGTQAALTKAWRAERAAWRKAPLQLGAFQMGDQSALEPLAIAIENGNIGLETAFLLDVGRTGNPRLAAALKTGEDWIEEEVVLAYATARILIGDDTGAKLLEDALNGDDPMAALEALDYLVDLEGDRATTLIKKARNGGTDLARAYAEMALAARGATGADLFDEMMLSQDPETRALAVQLAVRAMLIDDAPRKNTRIAKRVLQTSLGDESLEVRLAALKAAARAGVLTQGLPVTPHLADELLAVRIEAAGAVLAGPG
ncbi:MAG: hypothetical protein AB8H79_12490 [Myxococcota bacterium]